MSIFLFKFMQTFLKRTFAFKRYIDSLPKYKRLYIIR